MPEEVREMAKMPRTAKNRKEAVAILKQIAGKGELKSKSGLAATLSGKSIDEIASGQAMQHSFDAAAHLFGRGDQRRAVDKKTSRGCWTTDGSPRRVKNVPQIHPLLWASPPTNSIRSIRQNVKPLDAKAIIRRRQQPPLHAILTPLRVREKCKLIYRHYHAASAVIRKDNLVVDSSACTDEGTICTFRAA